MILSGFPMTIKKIKQNNFTNHINYENNSINPLTSPGEVVSVFTSPYLSAVAPTFGEAKGLMLLI